MKKSELLSYILHHIGLPLIKAQVENADGTEDPEQMAQDMAALLDCVVQESHALNSVLNMNDGEDVSIVLRLHIASLCSKIIAAQYSDTHVVPGEQDIKKIVASVKALMMFSDKYIPLEKLTDIYPENAHRPASFLKNLADIRYLEMLAPLVNVVAVFSFGLPHQKMMQDVLKKIGEYAVDMRTRLLGDQMSVSQNKEAERYILHTLVEIYVCVHTYEMQRIMDLDEISAQQERSDAQISNIWDMFKMRYDMLCVLTENVAPADVGDTDSNVPDDAAPQQFSEGAGSFRPMSFYKKSDDA